MCSVSHVFFASSNLASPLDVSRTTLQRIFCFFCQKSFARDLCGVGVQAQPVEEKNMDGGYLTGMTRNSDNVFRTNVEDVAEGLRWA